MDKERDMFDFLETVGDALKSAGEMIVDIFTDERQVHLVGNGRAHRIDWTIVHSQITPADPHGTGDLTTGYGSLYEVFREHFENELKKITTQTSEELFRARQYAIVETLNVTSSPRYEPAGKTYCNIYAYDFVDALWGYIPRVWWTEAAWRQIEGGAEIVSHEEFKRLKKEGKSVEDVVAPIYAETLLELNANSLNHWMRTYGSDFGWQEETDMDEAQKVANSGRPVVLLAANKVASNSGHISIILSESNDHQAKRDAAGSVVIPLQSQAGRTNFKYGFKGQWWSDKDHKDGAAWLLGR